MTDYLFFFFFLLDIDNQIYRELNDKNELWFNIPHFWLIVYKQKKNINKSTSIWCVFFGGEKIRQPKPHTHTHTHLQTDWRKINPSSIWESFKCNILIFFCSKKILKFLQINLLFTANAMFKQNKSLAFSIILAIIFIWWLWNMKFH